MINGGVFHHPLHVGPGFAVGDGFRPDVGWHGLAGWQPLRDFIGTGVVGGSGQHRVVLQALQHAPQIMNAVADVGLRLQQRRIGGGGIPQFLGDLPAGGGHDLHESQRPDRRAGGGPEVAFLPDDGIDPGRVERAGAGLGHHPLPIGQWEPQFQIVPVFGSGRGGDGLRVPIPAMGQHGRLEQRRAVESLEGLSPFGVGVRVAPENVQFPRPL